MASVIPQILYRSKPLVFKVKEMDYYLQSYIPTSNSITLTAIQEEQGNCKRTIYSLNVTGTIVTTLAFICGICIGYCLTRN